MQPDRPALPALTGIRFFAAIHVVFFHYAPAMPHYGQNVAQNGYLAVGLFFVLSGFVLAYNYAGRPLDAGRFWKSRFARIYPAYFVGFAMIAPAVIVRWHGDPVKLAASGVAAGSLLQGWIPGLSLVWNGPGWSLSNEAFFYFVFPLILPALLRLSLRGLWVCAGISWVAAFIPVLWLDVVYVPLFRLPEFLMGVVAGVMFVRRTVPARERLYAVTFALALYAIFSPDYVPAACRGAFAAPLFAVFIYALAGRGNRFLASSPMCKLGDGSYSVYILQSPLMAYFLVATQGIGSRVGLGWVEFVVYCGMLVAVSAACYRWIESPARRWLLKPRPQKKMVPSDLISSLAHPRHARY